MNIESMRLRSCRSFQIDDAELPAAARERLLAIHRTTKPAPTAAPRRPL